MSDKRYALGIDGGGTKTAFTLVDEAGEVVSSFVLPGSSFDAYSLEEIKSRFLEAKARLPYMPDAIFAGIGGILGEKTINLCKTLLNEVFPGAKADADNDVVNALYGLSPEGKGIILIAGTGSVAYGECEGKRARSGGYCYQEGDLGSSYDVGRKALQYFGKALDGREAESPLFEEMKEKLGFDDAVSFASYMESASRSEIASFSRMVTAHEEEVSAQDILLHAAKEVFLMVKAVYSRLDPKGDIPFAIIGGLGNAKSVYRSTLLSLIKERLPYLKLSKKEIDASLGAANKARSNL